MSDPIRTDIADASQTFDVVIVGAGIVGAILAKQLVGAGRSVLVLEAGRATSIRPEGYEAYVRRFQLSPIKSPNSPYPDNPNAPAPSTNDITFTPNTRGYFVSMGKLPFLTDYVRALGGTTLHFLGSCIRMLPHDFEMKSRYGVGEDWPISYDDLQPCYELAEREIGVAADVEEQTRHGTPFSPGYQFPMRPIPPTYLDRWLAKHLRGLKTRIGRSNVRVAVVGTPAGRNGMPNPKWKDRHGRDYHPRGMPYETRIGERCQGNSSCVPICPVMAKYNALRSLYSIDRGYQSKLTLIAQAVASRIVLDETRRRVQGIECKRYDNEDSPEYTQFTAKGRFYVLAAHSIENATLLLASNAANSSGQVGRNLMDHPYLVTWGLAPPGTYLGVYRGPQITSEIPVRDGRFRRHHAAFRADIRNGGWDFARGSPYSDLWSMVTSDAIVGAELKQRLFDRVQRQISFGFQVEQLPSPDNRIEIRDGYRDQLRNHRPVVYYDIDGYTRRGIGAALDLNRRIFARIGGIDCTKPDTDSAACIGLESGPHRTTKAVVKGAGHIMGTHRMGNHSGTSVVNRDLRSWDHDNLFVVGCGNMPSAGTSNPTLTAAALAFRAVERILKDLA